MFGYTTGTGVLTDLAYDDKYYHIYVPEHDEDDEDCNRAVSLMDDFRNSSREVTERILTMEITEMELAVSLQIPTSKLLVDSLTEFVLKGGKLDVKYGTFMGNTIWIEFDGKRFYNKKILYPLVVMAGAVFMGGLSIGLSKK